MVSLGARRRLNALDLHVSHLGTVESRREYQFNGRPLRIISVTDLPSSGVRSFVTCGLSIQSGAHGGLGDEVLFAQPNEISTAEGFQFLSMFVANLLSDGEPHGLGIGEVVEFSDGITPSYAMTAIAVCVPERWPERLWSSAEGRPPARYFWLLPLHHPEIAEIRRGAFDSLEDKIAEAGDSIWQPNRASLV